MSLYTLPDLPYDYAALEPHISGRIMQLHHDKHHAAYVAGANLALEQLAEAEASNDFGSVNQLQKNLAFNLSGHANHTIFWQNLTPDGPGEPTGLLAQTIDNTFGSTERFQAHFTAAALGIQGSGWAMLSWDTLANRLIVEQVWDHQSNRATSAIPLLVLDMWEHAFYLDYLNVKADYVKAFWQIVNWPDVAARFEQAQP
ncbi:MAG: superoxide dismutase [Bifidobacteriaceae bacterium]|jgi:Fe-Mn family superoxide dismutase|nr:superoxide dismutase [Bifidobacteriaceae bacterium]